MLSVFSYTLTFSSRIFIIQRKLYLVTECHLILHAMKCSLSKFLCCCDHAIYPPAKEMFPLNSYYGLRTCPSWSIERSHKLLPLNRPFGMNIFKGILIHKGSLNWLLELQCKQIDILNKKKQLNHN